MPSSTDSSNAPSRLAVLRPVIQPFRGLASYVVRALRSAAYPLQGIWYFLSHPELYPLFAGRIIPLSIISFLVYTVLFVFTFPIQFAFVALFHGWTGAWISTIFLVLGEGLVIIQGLFEGFFVDEYRVDVFDATLISHGLVDLITPQRVLFLDAHNSVRMLGKPTQRAEYQPWSLIQIVELIVFLPLNLIPFVGPPAFLIITGARVGKLSHYRWYKLRGLTKKEIKKEISLRVWEYTWFGTVAMLLELVPILSFFFLLSTTAGSALWVVKMEESSRIRIGRPITADDHVPAALEPPVYRDDPEA
ncbi:hypothetical protein B0H66DRAFT_483111 [Apodospora peruviana]|uniref:Uncharacterized protein n=1 Tax=Apodospora peruviana TaxID=516989 RepID=A0AAE0M117_9PEZI|nr:hypothetical protein B0H66DRAFT_483111 [Apodospora peruviana]